MRQGWFVCLLVACASEQVGPKPIKLTGQATTTTPLEGDRVQLTASHTGGGELSYNWTQVSPASPKGSFTSSTAETTQFVIPSLCADTTFEIKLTARDNFAQTAETTITLSAVNQNDAFVVEPNIATDSSTKLAGDPFIMSIGAKGPGCGPKYSWTQDAATPGGAFETDANVASVTWRAPAAGGMYKFHVNVTDDGGTMSQGREITLTVNNATWNDVKPMFEDYCTGCHDGGSDNSGGGVDFTGAALEPTLDGPSAATGVNTCVGQPLVDPLHPENSVLYKRLTGSDCGPKMPRNQGNFDQAHKDLIIRVESWIKASGLF